MPKEIKTVKDETIDENPLPELTPWDKIGGRPNSLKDLNVADGEALDDATASIGDVEDWKGYLDAILDAQTAEIIAEWTFKDSGALAIRENSNNGIWLSPTGILAKKSGDTTFSLTSSGDATFGGSLIAGVEITSPVITGGTITGGLIKTSSSGQRVEIRDSHNDIRIYDSYSLRMGLSEGALTFLTASETDGGAIEATGYRELTFRNPVTDITLQAGALNFYNSCDIINVRDLDTGGLWVGNGINTTGGQTIQIGTDSTGNKANIDHYGEIETDKVRVYGSMTANSIGSTSAVVFTGIPTSDPESEGAVWRDGTYLRISTG